MQELSQLGRLSAVLLAAGLLGVLLMLAYLRACAWADWDLLSSRVRRRARAYQRRAPLLLAGSGTVAGTGLVLGLVLGVAGALGAAA